MATKKSDAPKFEYLRAVHEDGTCSAWVNLAKPKHLTRWERENPDSPVPTTVSDQMAFVHMALGITMPLDDWIDTIEGLESREFEAGKANG